MKADDFGGSPGNRTWKVPESDIQAKVWKFTRSMAGKRPSRTKQDADKFPQATDSAELEKRIG